MGSRCQLEELSLECNSIGDQMAIDLFEALNKALPPLRYLNISRNNISDRGAVTLAEHFEINYHLKVVKIAWNKIQGKGGILIAEALKENRRIAYLDASFNLFGSKRNGEFGLKMGEAVNRGILRHLDISYNSMDKNECEKFGQTIYNNHTLWGLHMLGNECIVDSMGFVRAGLKSTLQTKDILRSPVQDGNSFLYSCKNMKRAKTLAYQMCWICEGWSEYKFEWRVGLSGKHFKEPIYIHFDFDEYRPWLMQKDQNDESIFYIWKMIPPGKSHYFYSFGGMNGESETARDQPHLKTQTIKHIREVLIEEIDEKSKTKVQYLQSYQLRSINYVFGIQIKVLDKEYDPVKFQAVVPRMSDTQWVRPFIIRPETAWSVPISIFKDWQIETNDKLDEAFEFDCSMIKFPKMTDEEFKEFKEELRKAYPIIKNTYKHISSIGSNGQVFSLALNSYTEIVKLIGLLDGKIINVSTSDTEFLAINKRMKHSFLNPGIALIRFQFVEILMKLSLKRYEETKEVKNKSDAIKVLLEYHLKPHFGHLNPQKWREERYWNEEIDNLYKSHFPIFDQLFKRFGCHYLRPGDKPFMMVDEFESIFVTANLINDNFIGRDCYFTFNTSLMPQVDEVNKDKHLKATFVEFLEAFARVCEKISYPPPIDEDNGDVPLTDQERIDQPLVKKIENLLPVIFESCMTNQFKERWQWPKRNTKTGLYIDKYYFKKKRESRMDLNTDNFDFMSPMKQDQFKPIFEI